MTLVRMARSTVLAGPGPGADGQSDDDAGGVGLLDAEHHRGIEDRAGDVRFGDSGAGFLLDGGRRRPERRAEGHEGVKEADRRVPGQVGERPDVPVRHVPDRPVSAPEACHPQRHLLHDAEGGSGLQRVADSVLVLGEKQEPGQVVPHQRLGPETHRRPHHRRPRHERREVDPDRPEDGEECDNPDDDPKAVGQDPSDGLDALGEREVDGGVVRNALRRGGGGGS